ncbi:uncharacterized protein LOC115890938 [Sitophilus oryzae]|uniref:Uncharacterized protein LOC115890938 n=1 Tax=Sitophilus oryzae TaxID=7048 RepID=A0A6J2YV50_SITOR|nr:uncharacterized protein LOC115890938 [Sitophilus oryzae]
MSTNKKKYTTYSKENLQRALDAIKQGVPCATASKEFNVPRTTLIGKIKGIYPEECKSGAATVLTSDEENLLEKWMINMGAMGFPITKDQLLDSVALLVNKLKRPNKFSDGRPGRHWLEGFLKRHPVISERMTQNISSSRASITKEKIKNWFHEIDEYFSSVGLNIQDPKRIFNTDESAFFLSPKGSSVLVKKGSKFVHDRSGDDKDCLTVLITGNAAGTLAPPMVMYPYERIPKHIVLKVPKTWAIGKPPSGWMTSESFYEYVTNLFYPFLIAEKIEFPVILYLDGHKSHVTLPLTEFCREKQIVLISLLPNSTHILQPLDVGLFRPLKLSWKKEVQKFKMKNGSYKALNRENFASVLNEAINSMTNLEVILKNAFKSCGLFPFDSSNINYSKLLLKGKKPETVAQNVISEASENHEIIGHLQFLESYINPGTLNKFKDHMGSENWTGESDDKNLYLIWHKICKDTRKQQTLPQLTANNVIIEFEDGFVMESQWEEEIIQEMASECEVVVEKDNVALETEFLNDGITITNETMPKRNGEYLSENQQVQISEENVTENQQANKTTPYINGDRLLENQYDVQLKELSSEISKKKIPDEDEVTPEKNRGSLSEQNDSFSNILPDVSIPTPFKTSLFWPEPSSTKKTNIKRKVKIPSVGTSDAWREYYIKKENLQKKAIEEKEDRKRKRQENKILREEERKTNTTIRKKRTKKNTKANIENNGSEREQRNNLNSVKEKCRNCSEELNSDLDEEEEVRHIGCDNCPNWFHFKCINAENKNYTEVATAYFKCDLC